MRGLRGRPRKGDTLDPRLYLRLETKSWGGADLTQALDALAKVRRQTRGRLARLLLRLALGLPFPPKQAEELRDAIASVQTSGETS